MLVVGLFVGLGRAFAKVVLPCGRCLDLHPWCSGLALSVGPVVGFIISCGSALGSFVSSRASLNTWG